ncbi:hypothetical protein D3C71_2247310 [compost metagenome]
MNRLVVIRATVTPLSRMASRSRPIEKFPSGNPAMMPPFVSVPQISKVEISNAMVAACSTTSPLSSST